MSSATLQIGAIVLWVAVMLSLVPGQDPPLRAGSVLCPAPAIAERQAQVRAQSRDQWLKYVRGNGCQFIPPETRYVTQQCSDRPAMLRLFVAGSPYYGLRTEVLLDARAQVRSGGPCG